MSFGISKCATMVIKPKDFKYTPGYVDPTFLFSMSSIPKVSCYTYLGIPFSEDLSLQPAPISKAKERISKNLLSVFLSIQYIQHLHKVPTFLYQYLGINF